MDFAKEYELRKANLLDELKTAYLDVYEDKFDAYLYLVKNLDNAFSYRPDVLKRLDAERSQDPSWYHKNNTYGMTVYVDTKDNNIAGLTEHLEYLRDFDISFINVMPVLRPSIMISKQGGIPEFISVDLNYGSLAEIRNFCMQCQNMGISVCFDNVGDYCKPENMEKLMSNPLMFNKLVFDMLMFANLGVDIFKINTRPYKWNELGLDYPYTDQDYHIVPLLRKILEIVCPGCILLCNAEFDDGSSFSYYGSMVHQECQVINNISTKEFLLEAIEQKNVGKLRSMVDMLSMVSRSNVFLNSIQDPWQEDWKNLAEVCGLTTAKDRIETEMAIDFDMLLQGYLMMTPGVPFMYLGDELGQVGSKSMDWSKTKLRFNIDSTQYKLYNNLMHLKRIREVYEVFSREAKCFTYDTFDPAVLGIVRSIGDKKIIGLFNFSPVQKTPWIIDPGPYTDLISNAYIRDQSISIKPYGMMWLYNQRPEVLEDY